MTRSTPFLFVILRVALAFLVAAAAYGAWQRVKEQPRPLDDPAALEADLRQRVAKYVELRKASDWAALYQMTNPLHRRSVSLAQFLAAFGHGALAIRELSIQQVDLDIPGRSARVDLEMEAELVPERIPEQYRRGFQKPEDPKQLQQRGPVTLKWVRTGADWYYDIDPAIVTGRDAAGKKVVPLDGG